MRDEVEVISPTAYESAFSGEDIRRRALDQALDIRKFEIQLYWTRAAYFWTFITVALAGLAAVQALPQPARTDFSVIVSCLGLFVSFAWYCANRGSKQWQENWENHVDLLEDEITGPLYKVVITRPSPEGVRQRVARFLTGPAPFSVSQINQIISLYVTVLWLFLLWYSLPSFRGSAAIEWSYVAVISLTILAAATVYFGARTHAGAHSNIARRRHSEVMQSEVDDS